jgi:WhiB family redox-sensing transcriptional regulator
MTGTMPNALQAPDLPLAACVGVDPELFYSEDHINPSAKNIAAARLVCCGCAEIQACFAWGIERERFGMWGGITGKERLLIRSGLEHQLSDKVREILEVARDNG